MFCNFFNQCVFFRGTFKYDVGPLIPGKGDPVGTEFLTLLHREIQLEALREEFAALMPLARMGDESRLVRNIDCKKKKKL